MDIMELGAIGELVGGVAVIVTLVYLAVQARYTAASSQLQASSAVNAGFNQAIAFMGQAEGNSVAQRAMAEGVDGLDAQERFLWSSQLYIMYSHLETVFFQSGRGLVDEEGVARSRTLLAFYQLSPGVQAWWHGNLYDDRDFSGKDLFTPEFRGYVGEVEAEGPRVFRERA